MIFPGKNIVHGQNGREEKQWMGGENRKAV
jgi:hypothetical protein